MIFHFIIIIIITKTIIINIIIIILLTISFSINSKSNNNITTTVISLYVITALITSIIKVAVRFLYHVSIRRAYSLQSIWL